MIQIIAFIFTYVYVIVILASIELLLKKRIIKSKLISRKIIHILIGNCIIIAYLFIPNFILSALPPFTFIFINWLIMKKEALSGMEKKHKRDYGTIWYPISFVLLIVTFWNINYKIPALIGLLIMSYGDGLATIIGIKYGEKKIKAFQKIKTLEGSITMFFTSLFVTFLVVLLAEKIDIFHSFFRASIIAFISTLAELYSKEDNLGVPIISAFTYYFFFGMT